MPLTLRAAQSVDLLPSEVDTNQAEPVLLANHGFSRGMLVTLGSTWEKAKADNVATVADGVVAYVQDVNNFWVVTKSGTILSWTHALGVDRDGTPVVGASGDLLWCSQDTGGGYIVGAGPIGGVQQPVGKILNSGAILFRLGYVSMGI